ncbi:ABC transporter substrate-binding protein [Synechococcales cyanobacterium C]|uniref:ABC transporter substrate-binding protein n=1 Tax=Petrachloros mirabilis ULC683 TaxID=2781853 RepID=A0A8K1ZXQ8_9CYAN|nr:iron-siderophore ABC transporter substrate-binding protein [Petrachloros mirabilis]NCJ05936.1 ABC transporter substrate-binding protein [Petrachloros mirabilis ULC683]
MGVLIPLNLLKKEEIRTLLAKVCPQWRGWWRWFLFSILTAMMVSACSSTVVENSKMLTAKPPSTPCRVVQHAMGETCIPQNPQRVVTLGWGILGNALALGITPIASVSNAGVLFEEHLRDKADGVEFVGRSVEPNLEKILLLKPDLIISNIWLQAIYTQLTNIAPTVVIDLPRGSIPFSWEKNLGNVAKILDKEQEGKQLINNYWQQIEKLKQALGDRRYQLQISVAQILSNGIVYYGKTHPHCAVLNDIGLQRSPAQRGDFYQSGFISHEHLSDIDGDVLFLMIDRIKDSFRGQANEKALEKLQKNPLWKELKVVQQKQVYIVDFGVWNGFDVLAMNAVIDDLFKYLVNIP